MHRKAESLGEWNLQKLDLSHELGHIVLMLKGFNITWAIQNNVTMRQYEALAWSVSAKFSKFVDHEYAKFCINTYPDSDCSAYLCGKDWQYLVDIGVIKKREIS